MKKGVSVPLTIFLSAVLVLLAVSCDDMGTDPFFKEIVLKSDGSVYETVVIYDGDEYTFVIPGKRNGYAFSGWLLDGKLYTPGETISVSSDMTVEAVWIPVNIVRIDYGDGMTDVEETTESTITLPRVPAREGYVFSSWIVGEESYEAGAVITVSGETTVTAEWVAVNTVEIDGKTVKESSDNMITLPLAPEKEGYHFNGWLVGDTLMKSGDRVEYSSTLVISASWTKIYTITIDYDDGISGNETLSNIGTSYRLPKTPVRSGYSFRGWILNGDEGNIYSSDVQVKIAADTTVKAIWSSIYRITVNYNDTRTQKETIENAGESLILPEAPSQTGTDIFAGWEVNGTVYNPGEVVLISGDTEIKAVWSTFHTVTIDYDKTVLSWLEDQSVTVRDDGEYTLPKAPTDDTYLFLSWTVTKGTSVETGKKPGEKITVDGDVGIKAVWKKRTETYTVTFDTNGGLPALDPLSGLEGFRVYLKTTPSKEGCTLSRWLKNGSTFDLSEDIVTENTPLTAEWKPTSLNLVVSVPGDIINIDTIEVKVGNVKAVTFDYPADGVKNGDNLDFTLDTITGLLNDRTDYIISVTTYERGRVIASTVYDSVYINGENTSKTVTLKDSDILDITPSVTTRAVVDSSYNQKVMASISFTDGTKAYYTTDGSEPTTGSTPYTVSGEEFEVPGNTTIRVFVTADSITDRWLSGDTSVSHSGISTYTIGATGPHGGIIFYDNRSSEEGWRFLEAAPMDYTDGTEDTFIFGPDGSVPTKEAAGKGYDNKSVFRSGYTAYSVCHNFHYSGDNGAVWYVPSVRELELMRTNLYLAGLGNFQSTFYWSSSTLYMNSTDETDKAYQIRFYDNVSYQKYEASRSEKARIRPITRF